MAQTEEQELQSTMRLWVIDDGETHWVAATSAEDALAALVESWGERPGEWDDEPPSVGLANFTKPHRIRSDCANCCAGFPAGTYAEIVIDPGLFCKLNRGVVSTTVY